MLSPTTLLQTLTLKVMLNLKTCQINDDKIFIEKSDFEKNKNNLEKVLFDLGFKEIILGSDNDLEIIKCFSSFSRKRSREEERNFFNYKNWISPSRIRNYLEEPFIALLTEVPDLKPFEEPENEMMKLYFEKGFEYEKFILDLFQKKKVITSQVMEEIPSPNYIKFQETVSLMSSGCPIIYQGLLLDGEKMIYGCPDFLIRSDYLKKLFPKMEFNFEIKKSKLNQPYYVIVDTKFKTLEINNSGLSWNHDNKLNISQMYLYQQILNKIQGEFNYAYLCGKRCKNRSKNLVLDGKEYLGEIDFNNKLVKNLEEEIAFALHEIRKLRELPIKFYLSNLPEKYQPDLSSRNKKFPKIKQYYQKEILKTTLTNNFNFDNISLILKEIPKDKLIIYLDFETLDLDLVLKMEDLGNDYNSTFLFQIGYYLETDGYHSLITNKISKEAEKENLLRFIKEIRNLENKYNKKAVFIIYSNYEQVNYQKLKEIYHLPELQFIDLYDLLKRYNFKTMGSYSLKTLSKELKEFYPNDFKSDYQESEIENGSEAMIYGYQYYENKSSEVLSKIEFYNKLDVRFMYEILNFLDKKKNLN
jgi:hypothetical protein